jgi:FkbM family methyltransferase
MVGVPLRAGRTRDHAPCRPPGDIVWDIGAHVGIHTVLLSSLVTSHGRVHAFEANPMRYQGLAETVRLLPNAEFHSYGLGSASASMTLFVPEDQTMASLADFTKGRVGPVTEVEARIERADDLLSTGRIPAPQFIKCDVEGAEYDVFQGSAHTLDTADAPIILYEANAHSAVAFGRDIASATLLLKALPHAQYQIYWVTAAPCAESTRLRRPALTSTCLPFLMRVANGYRASPFMVDRVVG